MKSVAVLSSAALAVVVATVLAVAAIGSPDTPGEDLGPPVNVDPSSVSSELDDTRTAIPEPTPTSDSSTPGSAVEPPSPVVPTDDDDDDIGDDHGGDRDDNSGSGSDDEKDDDD